MLHSMGSLRRGLIPGSEKERKFGAIANVSSYCFPEQIPIHFSDLSSVPEEDCSSFLRRLFPQQKHKLGSYELLYY